MSEMKKPADDKEDDQWKKMIALDAQKFTRDVIDLFNTQFETSTNRVPLVHYKTAVKEHYILILMQVFAHIFTGFAGSDTETEEKFMKDMSRWFVEARMDQLRIEGGAH